VRVWWLSFGNARRCSGKDLKRDRAVMGYDPADQVSRPLSLEVHFYFFASTLLRRDCH